MAKAFNSLLLRGELADAHLGFFNRLLVWAFILIGIAISLNIVGLSGAATGLLTGGGITAVILGFSFREIVENFLAGFFLAFSRPFRLGDRIRSGSLEGIVKAIELRSTHIRTFDGRDIFIPSSQIFKNPLINYTMDGLLRKTFNLGIDYTDDADDACELLYKTIQNSDLVLEKPAPFVGITEFTPNYVELTVYAWIDTLHPVPGVFSQRSALMSLCRRALMANGYTLNHNVRLSAKPALS
ncbi:MAG: mechanosensitive ion channel family protein [Gammaproteobacteria bacterium]|nr:mechanosensitive ion channel family protein [Gammaproteobacteria bacterium]